jgi:hypothetical protein
MSDEESGNGECELLGAASFCALQESVPEEVPRTEGAGHWES